MFIFWHVKLHLLLNAFRLETHKIISLTVPFPGSASKLSMFPEFSTDLNSTWSDGKLHSCVWWEEFVASIFLLRGSVAFNFRMHTVYSACASGHFAWQVRNMLWNFQMSLGVISKFWILKWNILWKSFIFWNLEFCRSFIADLFTMRLFQSWCSDYTSVLKQHDSEGFISRIRNIV